MEPLSLTAFASIKALCATVGLVIFMGIFIITAVWVFRPNSKKTYQDQAKRILNENEA